MKVEWTNKDSLSCEETTKAILVLNKMPKSCDECLVNSNGFCDVLQEYALLNEWVEDAPYYSLKEKGVCPLKPLPQKKEIERPWLYAEYENGWNDCLEEITGETE